MEHKKAFENRISVYFCLHHEFYKLLSIFGHFSTLQYSLEYFYNVFRDSEVCLERCDSYGDFGYLTKNQTFVFEEKFVKEHVVLLL